LRLGDLPRGEWRTLTKSEIANLSRAQNKPRGRKSR
jgi:hypothetical protein